MMIINNSKPVDDLVRQQRLSFEVNNSMVGVVGFTTTLQDYIPDHGDPMERLLITKTTVQTGVKRGYLEKHMGEKGVFCVSLWGLRQHKFTRGDNEHSVAWGVVLEYHLKHHKDGLGLSKLYWTDLRVKGKLSGVEMALESTTSVTLEMIYPNAIIDDDKSNPLQMNMEIYSSQKYAWYRDRENGVLTW